MFGTESKYVDVDVNVRGSDRVVSLLVDFFHSTMSRYDPPPQLFQNPGYATAECHSQFTR